LLSMSMTLNTGSKGLPTLTSGFHD
jgi:hypothetical protein